MTFQGKQASTARRPHDAEASREALLRAARARFDEVGYERATTREIGQRAGVDPALIARYFGGKEGLFLEAIAAAPTDAGKVDFEPRAVVESLLARWDERGHSPISRALASPSLGDDVRERVRALAAERLVEPLAQELASRGVPQPELRAELLIALALGIAVTRANGTLAALASEPREGIVAVLAPLIEALVSSTG